MGSMGITNGHSSLPDNNSEDIYLSVATEEEVAAQTLANSSEWKGALPTINSYFRREEYLANQELTKDGGLTGWSLVYQPAGSERQVLCGCETIKKKALVGRNGKVEEVVAHGVCSVFTPPKNRGKAYARRMMSELAKMLKGWQMDDGKEALFTVLFSDIGKKFYSVHGWQAYPSAHASLPVVTAVSDGLPPVRLLRSSDLPELCTADERLIRQRLAKTKNSAKSEVALVPDHASMRWHHAREEFVAKELFGRDPVIKGAIVGEAGSRVWCYWTRVFSNPQGNDPNTLHILRLAIEDESFSDFGPASQGVEQVKSTATVKAIAALFAAAQSEGSQWSMNEIKLWNPTSTALAAAQSIDPSVTVQYREKDSIPSLLWYGEGSWEGVDWICNEKYGWC